MVERRVEERWRRWRLLRKAGEEVEGKIERFYCFYVRESDNQVKVRNNPSTALPLNLSHPSFFLFLLLIYINSIIFFTLLKFNVQPSFGCHLKIE